MKVGKFILAFVGIAILLSTLPLVGTLAATAGIGYAGYKIGSSIVNKSKKVAGEKNDSPFAQMDREERKSRSNSKTKSNNPYFDQSKGEFHSEALPLDMKADLRNEKSVRKGKVDFECAGIRNLVSGYPVENGGYRFRFKVDDLATAQRVKEFTEGAIFRNHHGNASISQAEDGDGFIIESSDAKDIRALVKAAFPSTSCEVEQEVRTVNQYIIEGCSSYEEAVKKFNREKDSLLPDTSFIERRQTLNGNEMEHVFSNAPLNPTTLAVGTYIISEVVADARKATISVPGNIVEPDEISEFAVSAFDSKKAEKIAEKCIPQPQLFDATPAQAARFLSSLDGGLHLATDESIADVVSKRQPQFVFRCADMKEAEALLSGETIPEGRIVLLDSEMPKAGPGEFIVTIPATAQMLSMLKVEGEASANLMKQYGDMGISEADIHRSLVEDGLVLDGYVSARNTAGISTENAKVNGVSMSEISERLGNANLPTLKTSEEMNRWLADAAEIQSISVTVDAKKAELRVSSVVGGTQKTEIRKLSEDEMRDFAKRGELTKAEMKDFLMQTHPDYFRTYSDGNGGGTLQDPVSSFLKGKKPQKVAAKSNVQAQSPAPAVGEAQKPVQKPEPKQKPKKNNGPKL